MKFNVPYFRLIIHIFFVKLLINFVKCQDFNLSILHLNDFHARFLQTNIFSGRCSDLDQEENKCFGGFARVSSKVKEIREKEDNVIFLAAGDYFQGTIWYSVHKWRPYVSVLNMIEQDAMSLGNHEFDDGIDGIVPFLEEVDFPVLAANIDSSKEPLMEGKFLPSVVIEKKERKIGIVGYVTTETLAISNPGKIEFFDEVEAVRKESKFLKSQGVDIIIALGHAGYIKDLEIAKTVEEVDIVVGGHTNTFLYEGLEPSTETRVGSYPTVVEQENGRKVLVVQAYAFGKYLGYLSVSFDINGEITSWGGNPILLDNSVSQDEDILQELSPWKEDLNSVITDVIGRTFVFLDGDRRSCRMKECNLGNLITDAIVHQNAKYPDDKEWAATGLAIANGGGIRASIDEMSSNGSITLGDILSIAPFQNTIDIVEMRGEHVIEMFEHAVKNYDPLGVDAPGSFLQISGFQVMYDLSQPPESRVVNLLARCSTCRIPVYEEVSKNKIYKIAMPSFLANGGDNYAVIKNNKINHHLSGLLDTDILLQYIRLYSPIYQGLENRILFRKSGNPCHGLDSVITYSNLNLENNANKTTECTHKNAGNFKHETYLISIHSVLILLATNALFF